jgi:hypothetical protein
MRRELIQQEAFDRITNESITSAEHELAGTERILAKALGKDHVYLRSFTESTVMYETLDDTFVHAGYSIKDGHVTFNDIKELVVDHASKQAKGRTILSEMIDAVLVDKKSEAKALFRQYLEMVDWSETKKSLHTDNGKMKIDDPFKHKKGGSSFEHHHETFGEKSNKEQSEKHKELTGEKERSEEEKSELKSKAASAGYELAGVTETALNVLDYADHLRYGPVLAESISKQDQQGNITDLRVPCSRLRNESRLNADNWKTLNGKVKASRETARGLAENQDFAKAASNLKRQNAFSDRDGLEEALDHITKTYPSVLYVSQPELAKIIGEALQLAGAKNYDDKNCDFMAEGVLRKAHKAYSEKVNQILHLASAPKFEEGIDPYLAFQYVTEHFYPYIDEKFGLERRAFSDIYESLETVWKKADRRGVQVVKNETASYLNELADVLNGRIKPDIRLAEEAASYLTNMIETNLETGKWVVSNTAHKTVVGDHPDMAKKAKHGYVPASDFSGDWGDPLPMIKQDSMSYKGNAPDQARSNSWASSSTGGGDIFPKLSNPYVPKPFGDWTMKGEKGVDKDAFGQHWSTWQTSDTWPRLENPYVPQEAGGPGGTGHKMKDGPETDLVVDR